MKLTIDIPDDIVDAFRRILAELKPTATDDMDDIQKKKFYKIMTEAGFGPERFTVEGAMITILRNFLSEDTPFGKKNEN